VAQKTKHAPQLASRTRLRRTELTRALDRLAALSEAVRDMEDGRADCRPASRAPRQ
jgi:hypothetical protein